MKGILLSIIFFKISLATASSQSLSPQKVKNVKAATVRIMTEGNINLGTGFFVDKEGHIATCWHVVLYAITNRKSLYIELNHGEKIDVKVHDYLLGGAKERAVAFDFCILSLIKPMAAKVIFLKLGNFDNSIEGEEIYTCGYPLGLPQQFVSKGMLSTKYTFEENSISTSVGVKKVPRKQALLDLTLNRGNSGGPILRISKTGEDEVISIADFIINPLGSQAEEIIKSFAPNIGSIQFNAIMDSTGKVISGNDPNKISIIFAEAISRLSIGVSGGVSINYLSEVLREIKK